MIPVLEYETLEYWTKGLEEVHLAANKDDIVPYHMVTLKPTEEYN